jgi:hypothetical protein
MDFAAPLLVRRGALMGTSVKRILFILLAGCGLWVLMPLQNWQDGMEREGAGGPSTSRESGVEAISTPTTEVWRAAENREERSVSGEIQAVRSQGGGESHVWLVFDAGRFPERVPVAEARVTFGGGSLCTDATGKLVVPAETTELWIQKPGYLDSHYELTKIQASLPDRSELARELWLCPSVTLAIQVLWEDGEPVEGALVNFFWSTDRRLLAYGFNGLSYSPVSSKLAQLLSGPMAMPSEKEIMLAETNEAGRLELDRLPAGYPLRVQLSYGGSSEYRTLEIRGGPGAHESLHVQLSRGFKVSGTLRPVEEAARGNYTSPISVELNCPLKNPVSILTDEAGRFEFNNCPKGWIAIEFGLPYVPVIQAFIESDHDFGCIDFHRDLTTHSGRLISRWPIRDSVFFAVPSYGDRIGMAAEIGRDGRFSISVPPVVVDICLLDARLDMAPIGGSAFRIEPGEDPFELDIDPMFGLLRVSVPAEGRARLKGSLSIALQSNEQLDPTFDAFQEARSRQRHLLVPEGEDDLIMSHVPPGEYRVSFWAGRDLIDEWPTVRITAGEESRCIVRDMTADFGGLVRRLDGASVLGWRVVASTGGIELAGSDLAEDGGFRLSPMPIADVTVCVFDDRGATRLEKVIALANVGPLVELLVPEASRLRVMCEHHLPAWNGEVYLWSAEPGSRHRRLSTVTHRGSDGAIFNNLAPGRYRVRAPGAFESGIVSSQEFTLAAGEKREVLLTGHRGFAAVSFLLDSVVLSDVVRCWVKGRLPDGTLVSAELVPAGRDSFRCPAGLSQACFVFRRMDQGELPKIGLHAGHYWSIAATHIPIIPGQELRLSAEGDSIEFRGDPAWCAAAARSVAVVEVDGMSLQDIIGTFTIVPEVVEQGRIRMSPLPRGSVVSVLAGKQLRRQEFRLEGPLRLSQNE